MNVAPYSFFLLCIFLILDGSHVQRCAIGANLVGTSKIRYDVVLWAFGLVIPENAASFRSFRIDVRKFISAMAYEYGEFPPRGLVLVGNASVIYSIYRPCAINSQSTRDNFYPVKVWRQVDFYMSKKVVSNNTTSIQSMRNRCAIDSH